MRNTCSASTGSRPWPAIVRLSAPPRIAPAAASVARISASPMATGSAAAATRTSAWIAGCRPCPTHTRRSARCRAISRNSIGLGSTTKVIGSPARSSACPAASASPSTPGPTEIVGPLTLPGARHSQRRCVSGAGGGVPRSSRLAYGGMRMPSPMSHASAPRIEVDAGSTASPRSRRIAAVHAAAGTAGKIAASRSGRRSKSGPSAMAAHLHDLDEAAEAGRGVRRLRVHEEHRAAA